MKCRHCGSENTRSNGSGGGQKRWMCRDCRRTFSVNPIEVKYTDGFKRFAVWMYLNGVGVRKIALLLGTTHVSVLKWIKRAHKDLLLTLSDARTEYSEVPDIIEMDEIYTFVQKGGGDIRYGLLILEDRSALLRL